MRSAGRSELRGKVLRAAALLLMKKVRSVDRGGEWKSSGERGRRVELCSAGLAHRWFRARAVTVDAVTGGEE